MKKLFLFPLLLLTLCLNSCVFIYSNFDFFSERQPVEEAKLSGEGSDRILMIDISGEINNAETASFLGVNREGMVTSLREQLEAARDNKHIKAVLLRINSPGGGVTASDLIYEELKSFHEETKIPIYSAMMDLAASGGYYIAMASQKIYAHPTTVTGSIGVIMFNVSIEGLMKKIGVKSKVIKSGNNKDMGSPFKDLTPEEQKLLQDIIDNLYGRFVDVVASGRPKLGREKILTLADGRVYTADQAKAEGLVDEIAYLPQVIEHIKSDLKLTKATVMVYKNPDRYMSNIYSNFNAPLPKGLSLVSPELEKTVTQGIRVSGFYYLWEPGSN